MYTENMQKSQLKFPKRFLWGVSTSAHQIEGNNHNQWSVWELENAKTLAAQAPYQYNDLESWDRIKTAAKTPENYVSGRATNHYDLYERDLELVRKSNMNAFRLSIEWSRIEPEQGAWQVQEVEHYKAVLAACKAREIEPIVTLFHFTLPVWFAAMGGFEKASNVKYFVDFAERIMRELGTKVKYVITVNEPEVYASQSYVEGVWPPQRTNRRLALTVTRNLAKAHNQIAAKLHAASRRYKVSVAKNYSYIYAGDDAKLSMKSAQLAQWWGNDLFLRKVVKSCDFIGLNYYFSDRIYGYRVHNPDEQTSDVGWGLQPQNLEQALIQLHERYGKPIFITENGVADADDRYRMNWLARTIVAMQQAMDQGVDLIGYLHWSLTDNFEWEKGFWPRFGLFAVDYETLARKPRSSAIWLAKFLKKQKEMHDGKR